MPPHISPHSRIKCLHTIHNSRQIFSCTVSGTADLGACIGGSYTAGDHSAITSAHAMTAHFGRSILRDGGSYTTEGAYLGRECWRALSLSPDDIKTSLLGEATTTTNTAGRPLYLNILPPSVSLISVQYLSSQNKQKYIHAST